MINIRGLDKAKVLAALYNSSRVIGMGVLQARDGDMDPETARALIKDPSLVPDYFGIWLCGDRIYFDYVYGRVLKVDLTSNEEFREGLYDRDNGKGAAAIAIAPLRNLQKEN